ncbi:MAG TPA: hypothetical protein VIU61_00345 [Kofleriaceae bacterium]
MRLLLLVALAACDRNPPITSCDSDLSGIYEVSGKRWMLSRSRNGLEGYPLHDDSGRGSGEVAPRWLELARTPIGITGFVRRRFGTCESEAAFRITSCTGDTLEIVLADPPPPLALEPCTFGRPDSSRRERWRRVR